MTLLPETLDALTAVYRFFDAEGRLLYVGVSVEPDVRFGCHSREKPWWPDVDHSRTRIEWFPNRHAAITEENLALDTESPLHNVAGTTNLPVPASMRERRGYDNIRRVRVPQDLWDAYTEIVGDLGRSADLKAFIDWRINNPDVVLA